MRSVRAISWLGAAALALSGLGLVPAAATIEDPIEPAVIVDGGSEAVQVEELGSEAPSEAEPEAPVSEGDSAGEDVAAGAGESSPEEGAEAAIDESLASEHVEAITAHEPEGAPETAAAEEAEPAVALMAAATDTSSTPLSVGPVTAVVHRDYTGTGHGGTAQCGITSSNTEVFPDGNAAGAPADDSADDKYVCANDAVGYSIEFNFGSEELTEPYSTTMVFNVRDQGNGKGTASLRLSRNVASVCTSNSGEYTGVARVDTRGVLTCDFTFQPGVSGSVKLPPITLTQGDPQNYPIPQHVYPTFTLGGQPMADVPQTEVLLMPRVDLVTTSNLFGSTSYVNPSLIYVDGKPGVGVMFGYQRKHLTFGPLYSASKGTNKAGDTMSVGLEAHAFMIDPANPTEVLSLPEGARILHKSTSDVEAAYDYVTGEPLEMTVNNTATSLPSSVTNNHVWVWVPSPLLPELMTFQVGVRLDPTELQAPGPVQNFWREPAWDPGADEACSTSTGALGYSGVADGARFPNNNCMSQPLNLGQFVFGQSSKSITSGGRVVDESGANRPYVSPNAEVTAELVSVQRFTEATGPIEFCDVWDAPGQGYPARTNFQSLDPNRDVEVLVQVPNLDGVGMRWVTVPAEYFQVAYQSSDVSLGGATSSWVGPTEARCGAPDAEWSSSPADGGGLEAVNTIRVSVPRDGLRAVLAENGVTGTEGMDPRIVVQVPFLAPDRETLPADGSVAHLYDAMALNLGGEGSEMEFLRTRSYQMRLSYLEHTLRKSASIGTVSVPTNGAVQPGSVIEYRLQAEIRHMAPLAGDSRTYELTITDELPKCMVGDPDFSKAEAGGYEVVEYVPPTGDPCYGEGTVGRVTFRQTFDSLYYQSLTGYDRSYAPAATYSVTLANVIEPGTVLDTTATLSTNWVGQDAANPSDVTAEHDVFIAAGPAKVAVLKSVDDPLIQTGDRAGWTVTIQNSGSGDPGSVSVIDVLPYDGDGLGSSAPSASVAGEAASLSDLQVDAPLWRSTEAVLDAPEGMAAVVSYTAAAPGSIVRDPADASNQEGGATDWCTPSAEDDCASVIAGATAIRIDVPELPPYSAMDLHFTASTADMLHGSVLVNQTSVGRASNLTLEVPLVAPVRTEVYDLLIDGIVWYDTDSSASYEEGEPLLEGATVELLDAEGAVVATAVTNAGGYYWFGYGFDDDGVQPATAATPGAGGHAPLFLPEGTYATRVVHPDGVVLAEWEFTYSGGNEVLEGESRDLPLGLTADHTSVGTISVDELYQRADFGLVGEHFVSWTKVDEAGEPLAGATFSVTGPDGVVLEVADNGELDLDEADGAVRVEVPALGSYTVAETAAPEGYVLTVETLAGELTIDDALAGRSTLELGELGNVAIDYFISWTKVDEAGEPLAGATFSVTGPDGVVLEVADNGEMDLDDAEGAVRFEVPAAGTYTVAETAAPEGYSLTTETLTGEVTNDAVDGVAEVDLGELANERIPEPEPTPEPSPEPTPEPSPTPEPTPTPSPSTPAEPKLPSAGTNGLGYLSAASLLLVAAGAALVSRRRA